MREHSREILQLHACFNYSIYATCYIMCYIDAVLFQIPDSRFVSLSIFKIILTELQEMEENAREQQIQNFLQRPAAKPCFKSPH